MKRTAAAALADEREARSSGKMYSQARSLSLIRGSGSVKMTSEAAHVVVF